MSESDHYSLRVFMPSFAPFLPKMANTICIVHSNVELARAAPDWLVDLRFTHLPIEPAEAFKKLEIEAPPNLRVGLVFPQESSQKLSTDEMSQVLQKYPRRGYDGYFEQWREYWRGQVLGKRAVVYTRNTPFLRLFRELGVRNLGYFLEVHQLRYWRKVKANHGDLRPANLKRLLKKHRDEETKLMASAEKVFFISQPMKTKMERARPELRAGVLRCAFHPGDGTEEVRDNPIDLSDDARDIDLLYSGQLYDWKGVHVAIEALRHCDPSIRLTIVGGNNAGDVSINKQIAEHLGVDDRIDWLGHQPPSVVREYQGRAKLSLVPLTKHFRISKWYTSPIKVFELMGMGVPLLVANLPTLRDLLQQGVTAEFAEPNQPKEWGEKIERMLKDKAYRLRLAQNGLEYVKQFTYERRAERIRDEIIQYRASLSDPCVRDR